MGRSDIATPKTPRTLDSEVPATRADPAEWHTFEAGPFTLPAGSERFLCYSHVLQEDLWVDNIVLQSHPVVHHVVYSKTTSPDPEGVLRV